MRRVWLWSAEFHCSRLPNPDVWRDQLEKLGLGEVSVVPLGNTATSLRVRDIRSPG